MTIDFQGPQKTVKNCLDFLKEEYGLKCTMIVCETKSLFSDYSSRSSETLGSIIEELYLKETGKEELGPETKFLFFGIACEVIETHDEANTPIVRYIL